MKYSLFYQPDCSIYPGEFVPKNKSLKTKNYQNANDAEKTIKPPVNLIELPEHLRIELAIPGAKREDFVVEIEDGILKVFVETTPNTYGKNALEKIHEFSSEKYERLIALPGNADTTIIYAEYHDGILRVHIPKSNNPKKERNARIVVY